ncbi:MAG: hypothetical protein EAZ59_04445 [Oscillatoriales cyanobacterium]|nr:MAG: hypothetical protein EAZ59_04445 [Oscillatoriales cyanobacterium]
MAIKRAVKPQILYYFLIEAEPLDIHYQAEPGNKNLLLSHPFLQIINCKYRLKIQANRAIKLRPTLLSIDQRQNAIE